MTDWHQWVGALGVILIIGAYLLLQIGRLTSRHLSYSIMNALGALLLVVSLLFDFNLSALIVEGFWVVISVIGMVRCMRRRGQEKRTDSTASRG